MNCGEHLAKWALPFVLLGLPGAVVAAESYPTKPIRMVVPFPPGGISDVLGRMVAQGVGARLGHPIIIDNRPGAGTTLASELVAKSPADGYTLYLNDITTLAINETLYTKLAYSAMKDFASVAMLAATPLILVVNPSVPATSVKELIVLAKAKPGQINYASSGNGAILHLAGEMLKAKAGIDIVHVPYRGAPLAVQAVLAGETNLTFATTPVAIPHIKTGRLRALAVTPDKRSALFPELPAMTETLPGYDLTLYSAILGPAGMPKNIVQRLNGEIAEVLALPKIRSALTDLGAVPLVMSPEQLAQFFRQTIERLRPLVKASGARAD